MALGDRQTVTIDFPYQDPVLSSCSLPRERLSAIYDMETARPVADLKAAIKQALDHPIGTPSLREIASRGRRVVLIVDDMTRPTPVAEVLPFVLEELREAGIEKGNVSIVIAVGSHRAMSREEIAQKIGADAAREYRVINSRFWDPKHLVHVGTSEDGVKVLIEEEVVRADIKIGIGSIVPHAAVGWSGGGKIIYPGVAGKETVTHFHFTHGLTEENLTGRVESVVRERMESWVDMVGLDYIVNCILTPDDHVFKVVAGHYIQAQRRGVELAQAVYGRKIKEKTDICISVSYTHDIDFWQGTKGIYSGEPLVRDGGTLLLLTPCTEGLGLHTEFPAKIGDDRCKEIMEKILRGQSPMPRDPLPLPPGAMLAKLRKRIRCAVVSPGLTEEEMHRAKYEKYADVQTAVEGLMGRYPEGKISVVMRSDLTFFE